MDFLYFGIPTVGEAICLPFPTVMISRWRAAGRRPYRVPPLGSHRTLASLVQWKVPRRGGGIAYSTDYTNIGGCFAIDNPPVSFAASPLCTKGPLAH